MLLLNFYITLLANLIIKKHYNHCGCLFIFTDHNMHFNYNGNMPAIQIKLVNETVNYELIFKNFGCQGIVIFAANSTKIFVEFEAHIRLKLERFNRRRFLIVSLNTMDDFFMLEELDYVCDVLLVAPSKLIETHNRNLSAAYDNLEVVFELKTHQYVGYADYNEVIILDWWFSKNQSFLFGGDNLYPDKLTNQLGRPLRMATFTYEPYSIIGRTVDEHHGSELVSAVQFALKHNMTPVPVVNDEDYWGEIFPNWSGNGLLGNLVADKADVGFSALYTWEIHYHYLDLSKPLVRTGITCLVPAPKLAARWLTPLYSFAPQLWIYVLILFVVFVTVLGIMSYCYKTFFGFLERPKQAISLQLVIKPSLQQPLTKHEIPPQFASSFMFSLMLVFSLFLTSTYSSGLATVMTIPKFDSPINTLEEFSASGLDWGATQNAWITSIQTAEESVYLKIVSKFHPIPEEELRTQSKTGKFAFSIERLPSKNYAIGTYLKKDVISNFHLMAQDLYWEQCVIMLRKNSVLLQLLDLFILRIFESGVISYWQNKAVMFYMDSYVQRAVRYYEHHSLEQNVVQLDWSHIEGAFAVLAIGYCISIGIFLIEILWHRRTIHK